MARSRDAMYKAVLFTAGSLGVFLTQWLLCRFFARQGLSPSEAFLTALTSVSVAVMSGAAISWFPWRFSRRNISLSYRRLIVTSGIGWVWVPAVVLLSRQGSMAALPVAVVAAIVMASCLRTITASRSGLSAQSVVQPKGLFAGYLDSSPRDVDGFLIAVCVYAACFALHKQFLCSASYLLAFCAFFLMWRLTGRPPAAISESRSAGGLRLARAASTAVLITMALLLLGLRHGNSSPFGSAFAYVRKPSASGPRAMAGIPATDFAGYKRIILWPVIAKKKVIVAVPAAAPSKGFDTSKPLTIPFNGSYWYFQPRGNVAGTKAHVARGSPLTANIRSANYIPLIMEARQSLAAPIPLECCRAIRVTIENGDNAPGVLALGILLTDSTSIGKPTLYLDQQTIISTEPGHFAMKSSPIGEELSFRIPNQSKIRQFDEITVIFFPDTTRPNRGAKIAIKQFELAPR